MIDVLDRVDNTVGKGENTAFSPFPTIFLKAFLFKAVKTRDCFVKS